MRRCVGASVLGLAAACSTEPRATLVVNPASIVVSGFTGAAPPTSFQVQSVSGDSVHWTASVDQPWTVLSPTSGTTPTTVTLTMNLAGLGGGTFDGSIGLNPAGGPAAVLPVRVVIPSAAGTWSGHIASANLDVSINIASEGMHGVLAGTGAFQANGNSIGFDIGGSHSHPAVTLTFTTPNFAPATYSGTIVSATTMLGVLNGSGFVNDSITFTRF